jgi:hypothetical protein
LNVHWNYSLTISYLLTHEKARHFTIPPWDAFYLWNAARHAGPPNAPFVLRCGDWMMLMELVRKISDYR